jgi:hypothetical protein
MCDLGTLYFVPAGEATKIKLSDLASTEPINDFFALTFLSRILSRFTFCCDIYFYDTLEEEEYIS